MLTFHLVDSVFQDLESVGFKRSRNDRYLRGLSYISNIKREHSKTLKRQVSGII